MTTQLDCIIKVGGSALTYKTEGNQEVKKDALRTVAKIMTLCMVKHMKCILVHGAGSFGHGSAKQWGLNLGWKGNQKDPDYPEPLNRVKMGFCITHREVLLLNQMLARELTEHGVQALAQSPVSTWETDYGIVVKHSAEVLARQVELGFIPLLHGDTVFDRSWGCHVLSGDTIVEVLSSAMSVKRVIYLTDVCGVYDKPPEIGGATLIPRLCVSSNGDINCNVKTRVEDATDGAADTTDATGSFQTKLSSAVETVVKTEGSTPVFICKLMSQGAINAVIKGEISETEGTVLTMRT